MGSCRREFFSAQKESFHLWFQGPPPPSVSAVFTGPSPFPWSILLAGCTLQSHGRSLPVHQRLPEEDKEQVWCVFILLKNRCSWPSFHPSSTLAHAALPVVYKSKLGRFHPGSKLINNVLFFKKSLNTTGWWKAKTSKLTLHLFSYKWKKKSHFNVNDSLSQAKASLFHYLKTSDFLE
jgi:hypothetical protein